jgi:hypothetical protein
MCLRRAPEKYIAGASLDRTGLDHRHTDGGKVVSLRTGPALLPRNIIFMLLILIYVSRLRELKGLLGPGRIK